MKSDMLPDACELTATGSFILCLQTAAGQERTLDNRVQIVNNFMPQVEKQSHTQALMYRFLVRLVAIIVVTSSLISRAGHAVEADVDSEQAVRSVLVEIASTADRAYCDENYIKAEIADVTSTIQRGSNLEAFYKVDRNAALLATCGPQRQWRLSSTAEFVATQLVVAVQLQSRLSEQQRNLYVIRRDSQWATVLIQYARMFPESRVEAEKDWADLEQSHKQLSATGQLP